jgi:hypothetical protein
MWRWFDSSLAVGAAMTYMQSGMAAPQGAALLIFAGENP